MDEVRSNFVTQLTVRVTEIGEFIRHHSCERRFKLDFNQRAEAQLHPLYNRLFNSIDPVLQVVGKKREDDWEAYLQAENLQALNVDLSEDQTELGWYNFVDAVQTVPVGQEVYLREVKLETRIADFNVNGRVDFLLLRWIDNQPTIWIVEAKSSRRDRTYHRVQVTLYWMMMRRLLDDNPITVSNQTVGSADVRCLVVRIDETTNQPQAFLEMEPLDNLEREEYDILRLLNNEGPLVRIINSSLSDLNYQLDQKCDGCVFNTNCLPESARLRRLELLGLDPSTIRILKNAGIISIDNLAEVELDSSAARDIRNDPGFSLRFDVLRQKAKARRQNLPGGLQDPDEYQVMALPFSPQSQLPEHEQEGQRLIRIYLNVDYDYIENRLIALSAHITNSTNQLITQSLYDEDGTWLGYDPEVKERSVDGDFQPVRGETVIEMLSDPWTGRYEDDTYGEKHLIQGFFRRLVRSIDRVAQAPQARIHFYVWSRSEMRHLIEACSRAGSRLLRHLQELMGCRDSLDQLIYSCIQAEVENRFALGWTGQGLVVTTSLTWFGERYHWCRTISGEAVRLDQLFTQDIFDFKTDLYVNPDGTWANEEERASASRYKYEIRSRFYDSLTAPYWYAYWNSDLLPDAISASAQVRQALNRYRNAVQHPSNIEEYLNARVHALRWLEEKIRFKNADILKTPITIADLTSFELGVETVAQSAIDFLRLDHHVKLTDWISNHFTPVAERVARGETIPVIDVTSLGNVSGRYLASATIDLENYGITAETLSARSRIREGSFVRIIVCSDDPNRGQTVNQLLRAGSTGTIEAINWDSLQITLSIIPSFQSTRYILHSHSEPNWDSATIDENVTDFVAGTVENALQTADDPASFTWLDPTNPSVPAFAQLESTTLNSYRDLLENLPLPNGRNLVDSQITSILEGLDTRIQLLQGPPGTGKTTTSSVAVLLRILNQCEIGDVVLIAANTHPAVDTFLEKIDDQLDGFVTHIEGCEMTIPPVILSKVHSSPQSMSASRGRIQNFPSRPSKSFVRDNSRGSILIVGGTTKAILKLARELGGGRQFPNGFDTKLLIVDEASMMVFPHFLAISSFVRRDGQIMLSGDHRQLAPIVAHDWEDEDRPPVIIYQPFVSAYSAIDSLAEQSPNLSPNAICRSRLNFTFRLPPAIRDLISRLYLLDDIQLEGLSDTYSPTESIEESNFGSWESIWRGGSGLFLVLHSERESRQYNELEAEIIDQILSANSNLDDDSVAIVTPYRAQRSLLQNRFDTGEGPINMIDTVERLQGGERPTIIVSAVASDPFAISSNAEFILNLNRSNVAFSRSQERLIVICSEELINFIPADMESYDSAMLWKALRSLCSRQIGELAIGNESAKILTIPVEEIVGN